MGNKDKEKDKSGKGRSASEIFTNISRLKLSGMPIGGVLLHELHNKGYKTPEQIEHWRQLLPSQANQPAIESGQSNPLHQPGLLHHVNPDEARIMTTDYALTWCETIKHPSVVLIIGCRGSGKTGLAFYLLELFHCVLPAYVVGFPCGIERAFPKWMGTVSDIEELPEGCIALVDEAHLFHGVIASSSQRRKMLSRILNISRQKRQSLIFVTQVASHVDLNIFRAADIIIFKQIGMLHQELDRTALSGITVKATEAFKSIKGDKRQYSYVYPLLDGSAEMLRNDLPSFWSDRISNAFATTEVATTIEFKPARVMDKREKKKLAKLLRDRGHTFKQIATILDVSVGTACNYVYDYPYKK